MNKNLNDIKKGESCIIKKLNTEGSVHRRLLDMGFVEGTEVKCIGKSPLGDPRGYLVRGTLVALREEESSKIEVNS